MKTLSFIFILSLFLIAHAIAQGTSEQDQRSSAVLSLGIGFGNENNLGHWGIFVSNELKTDLSRKLALNPRLSYFETLAVIEGESVKGYSSHSGLFMDLGLSYSFVRKKDYAFSLNAGPSYQIGNQTRTKGRSFAGDELIDESFEHTRIRRLGLYTDLEYSWNTAEKFIHSVALKSYSFHIYPEFVGLGYKIGFKL